MFIDHVGYATIGKFSYLNLIGRIAFPIFAFQATQGYIYTKNFKKHIIKLLIFGCISQIPFMLFLSTFNNQFYLNIFFTIILGLLAIYCFDKIKNKILGFLIVLVISIIGYFAKVDYGFFGVFIIFLFYLFRNNKFIMALTCIPLCFIRYLPNIISYPFLLNRYLLCGLFTSISVLFILAYNNKQGPKSKYFFYIFYPLHLLILYLINMAL